MKYVQWIPRLLALGVIVAVVWMAATGTLVSTLLATKQWGDDYKERLYGNWYWWDHAISFAAGAFAVTFIGMGGWVVGRLWTVRKYSDFPKWAQRFVEDDGKDEEVWLGFPSRTEKPSRKDMLMFVPIVIVFIWIIVTP